VETLFGGHGGGEQIQADRAAEIRVNRLGGDSNLDILSDK